MRNLVKWEVLKLLHQKKTWVAVAVIALLAMLLGYAISGLGTPEGVEVEAPFDMSTIHPLVFPVILVGVTLGLVMPVFAVVTMAELFAGEYSAGTLKTLLLRPLGRTRVFAAKLTAGYINILGLLLVVAGFGLLAGYIFFDSANPMVLVGTDWLQAVDSVGEVVWWSTRFILLSSVPLFAYACFAALIATVLDSSAGVIMSAIGYLIGLNILTQVGFEYGRFLLQTEHFGIADGLLSGTVLWGEMATPLVVIGAFLVGSIALGWNSFNRKQIVL